tara:strand:+ start:1081 stop:1290 length:210 start_codon:yes stop_codon:yes gene_type:complete
MNIIPKFIRTGEKAGALNFFKEFNKPIFNADNDIKNKKGDIFFNKSDESSLVFGSNPNAKILISSTEKK